MTYAESNFAGSAIAANNQATFTFSYLDVSEIRVDITVGSTTTTYSTSSSPAGFTVVSPNQFVTLSSHPADTDAIRIYRVTNLDTTQATFVSGSAISANDLNNNYKQTLQAAQETRLEASQATSTANTAKTTADAATVTSGNAVTTANNAVTTANGAVTTANAASATATTADNTATNAANTVALYVHDGTNPTGSGVGGDPQGLAYAINTANSASTASTNAVNTANTADANATAALNNSRESDGSGGFVSAVTKANTAITTANAADATANTALTTANTASTTATGAVTTANSASATATAAANAVANAAFYSPVAVVANIPGSPANLDRIEIANSTGIETFSPLTGVPSGFVGSSDLVVRLEYDSANTTWTWKQYFAADPEGRYLTNYLPVVKGDGTSSGQAGKIKLNCSNNNHGVAIQSPPHSAAASYTLTLPTALPTVNGQSLISDTSGNMSFTTVDAAFVETPQTLTSSKAITANVNAAIMGPTVAIASGTVITIGANSLLSVLK